MDMGRGWDSTGIAFDPELWAQCFRVLKPGGHLMAFSATRTFHRMAVAIENAGFEVRDTLMWCYSSGFPKSMNVAKAFDKQAGVQGEVIGHKESGLDKSSGICVSRDGARGRDETGLVPVYAPASADAQRWQGWGTTLKPAWEPIVLARKALSGTIIETVRAHGTGALNIDGCRVPATDGYEKAWDTPTTGWSNFLAEQQGKTPELADLAAYKPTGGRWPPNILMSHSDECRVVGTKKVGSGRAKAPQYSEAKTPGIGFANALSGHGTTYGEQEVAAWECHPSCPVGRLEAQTVRPNGKGGASKCFPQLPLDGDEYEQFYHAGKATRREREEGCGQLALKVAPAIEAAGDGEARAISAPGAGTGRTATKGVRNNHPTVKPVSVMQWCIRLSTQPGGVVLDPFMGSGTTGVAAMREGMRFVGVEMSPEYMEICRARIGHAAEQKVEVRALGGATGLPAVSLPANKPAEPRRSTTKEILVFVKTIESNVKKGVKAELGPRTLIIGPNGIGKSSIVNAIELAISGRASDVIGRADVARGIDLLALAPASDDALWAKAGLSSGEAASWRCEKNAQTGGAREAVHEIPRDVRVTFPVREVRHALEGKAETARVWLLGRIGSTVTDATVRGLLPEELHAVYAEVTQPLFGTPVQVLLDAREAVAKTARSLGGEAKSAEKLADQMGAGLGVEPTDADIEQAQQRVREATVALASVGRRGPSPEVLRADAESKVRNYQQLAARVNELRALVGNAPLPDETVAKLRESLVRVMAFTAQQRPDSCLVCGVSGPNHDAIMHRAQSLVATVQQDIQRAEAHAQLADAERRLAEALAEAQAAVASFQSASQAAPEASTQDAGEIALALQTAEAALRGLTAAQAAWSGVRAAKARARDATARQRLYGDLKDAINEAVGGLLERGRREFVGRVQKLLPETDVFDLVLTEGEREVCKFGFVRDGMLHTAVSGAEWARLTLALAASVASDGDRDIALLTPEERAFDPISLRAVMAGLSHAAGQVILTSPVAPQGRTPKGWTVIDLTPADEPKPRKAKEPEPTVVAVAAEPAAVAEPVQESSASHYIGGEASDFEKQPAMWIDDDPPKAQVTPAIASAFGLGGAPTVIVAPTPTPTPTPTGQSPVGLDAILGIGGPPPAQTATVKSTPNIDDFFASFLVK